MPAKSKTALTTDVTTDITTNGNNEITGAKLNTILDNIILSYEDFIGSYTTAQIAALAGMTTRQRVFNTTDNDYEWYDGTRWVKEAHPKYMVYSVLLTQASTNDPTEIILENNLGTITLTYFAVGIYQATSAGLFTQDKTFFGGCFIDTDSFRMEVVRTDANTVDIQTRTSGNTLANDCLNNRSFEIRVFY